MFESCSVEHTAAFPAFSPIFHHRFWTFVWWTMCSHHLSLHYLTIAQIHTNCPCQSLLPQRGVAKLLHRQCMAAELHCYLFSAKLNPHFQQFWHVLNTWLMPLDHNLSSSTTSLPNIWSPTCCTCNAGSFFRQSYLTWCYLKWWVITVFVINLRCPVATRATRMKISSSPA